MGVPFRFKFSNLCGSAHRSGNVLFTPDGNSLLSAVGGRVTVFDLVGARATTLPLECSSDISTLAISPKSGTFLLIADSMPGAGVGGLASSNLFLRGSAASGGKQSRSAAISGTRLILVNLHAKLPIHRFSVKGSIAQGAMAFSPCEKYFALGVGRRLEVWKVPSSIVPEFSPFERIESHVHHYDDILSIDWSNDSSMIITGSRDLTARVYVLRQSLRSLNLDTDSVFNAQIKPLVLTGHKDHVIKVAFIENHSVVTAGREGTVFCWKIKKLVGVDGKLDEIVKAQSIDPNDESDSDSLSDNDLFDTDEKLSGDASPVKKRSKAVNNIQNLSNRRILPCADIRVASKHLVRQAGAKFLISVVIHKQSGLLICGLSNGVFVIFDLPDHVRKHSEVDTGELFAYGRRENPVEFTDLVMVHALSASKSAITSADINASGDWLAIASSAMGQLVVWEWRSETHILRQQGHLIQGTKIAFSPDGRLIASGGGDGKVKLWGVNSGFCNATFSDHTSMVTDVAFPSNDLVISSSLDGTVRAYDIKRYRCFRIMVAPPPARQFEAVAADSSGDIIAAGCRDTFEVVIWALRTGRVLDVLAGHTAPISCLGFCPGREKLATGSWDMTVRVWDIYSPGDGTGAGIDVLRHSKEVVALAFRPDGKILAVSTLDGEITFWDVQSTMILGTIDGRRDAAGGRSKDSFTVAPKNGFFKSLCYSADGKFLLAGGDSNFVCVYHVPDSGPKTLFHRYAVSENKNLDGILDKLSTRDLTASGAPLDSIEDYDSQNDDYENYKQADNNRLPGVKSLGQSSKRKRIFRATTHCVKFSPTGRMWAAMTDEGLLLYTAEADTNGAYFDPTDLDIDITPETARKAVSDGNYGLALRIALRLNDKEVLTLVIEAVPFEEIGVIVSTIPVVYFARIVTFFAWRVESSPHLLYNLTWCQRLLANLGPGSAKVEASNTFTSCIRALQRSVQTHSDRLSNLCEKNGHMLNYLMTINANAVLSEGNNE